MTSISPELRIVEFQNEWIVKSRFPFVYERSDTPRLAELRDRYRLDDVIAGGETEWDQLLRLREWVHGRWDHGWATAKVDDAIDVLEKAEQGLCFSCGYYSTVFVQCALALGFQARRLGITKPATDWVAPDERAVGHALPEVWSQDWHKWVVLDPDVNIYYEHDGIPLSALEIHRLWKTGLWREARVVRGQAPFRLTTRRESGFGTKISPQMHQDNIATFTRYQITDYYTHISWDMRNNHLSSNEPVAALRWFDDLEPPQLCYSNRPVLNDHWTRDECDAYWTLNQASIDLRLIGDDLTDPVIRVCVDHSMPNVDRVLVKMGEVGTWEPYAEPIQWRISPGKSVVSAKPINKFGREGYTSRIVLRFIK